MTQTADRTPYKARWYFVTAWLQTGYVGTLEKLARIVHELESSDCALAGFCSQLLQAVQHPYESEAVNLDCFYAKVTPRDGRLFQLEFGAPWWSTASDGRMGETEENRCAEVNHAFLQAIEKLEGPETEVCLLWRNRQATAPKPDWRLPVAELRTAIENDEHLRVS